MHTTCECVPCTNGYHGAECVIPHANAYHVRSTRQLNSSFNGSVRMGNRFWPDRMQALLITNVYNSYEQPLPQRLHNIFTREIPTYRYGAILVAGDFNLHYPLWNPQGYPRQDPEADTLVEA